MNKTIKFLSFLLLAILFFACKPEQLITTDPSAKITFSKDTVLFDTVFTTVGSVTKRFVIYNKNKNAVNISNIHLTNENDFATYRLNADGIAGNNIVDLEIKGNDSAFVFVEVTLKANAAERPFLIADSIQFTYNEQKSASAIIILWTKCTFLFRQYFNRKYYLGKRFTICNLWWHFSRQLK